MIPEGKKIHLTFSEEGLETGFRLIDGGRHIYFQHESQSVIAWASKEPGCVRPPTSPGWVQFNCGPKETGAGAGLPCSTVEVLGPLKGGA